MSAPTKPSRAAKKAPAKKAAANGASRSTSARARGNSDARDAVLRAAEQAREDGLRTSIQAQTAQTPKIATVDDVRDMIADMPDRFIQCRDLGHNWKIADSEKTGRGRQAIRTRTLFCPSCKYNKYQTFDSEGTLVHETPDYPEGYLMKGKGRIDRHGKGQFRIASIDRYIEKKASR